MHQIGASARRRVQAIARELDEEPLPFAEWLLLHANLLRLERALGGGASLIDTRKADQTPSPRGAVMKSEAQDPTSSLPTLMRSAIAEARELARLEVALAKLEIRQEVAAAKKAGIGFGVGTVLAIAGVTLLLTAIALAFSSSWLPALLVGVITLVVGGLAGAVGYRAAPKQPLGETRRRATTEVRMLKEHSA